MSLSASPPREASAWKTPLYDQYWALKDEVPQAILFFRLGDFYELFGDDALVAAPLLEVQLTARNKNHPEPIPMCGVPAHALDSYAEKLLGKGHKIAIADQVESAEENGRKLVGRELVRILTPGLPVDYEKLQSREAHWLVSIARKPRAEHAEILVFDLLGSKLFEGIVETREALEDLLMRLQPREILIESSWFASPKALEEWGIGPDVPAFRKTHWTAWGTNDARKNLEEYLAYTQRRSSDEVLSLLPEARGLTYLSGQKNSDYSHIPQSVLEQWAVLPELYDLFDRCGSAVGSRRLRELITRPLINVSRIQTRQKLLRDSLNETQFLEASREVYDFERLLGRFRLGVAHPLELLRFRASLVSALKALKGLDLESTIWRGFLADENLSAAPKSFPSLEVLEQELAVALKNDVELKKGISPVELIQSGYDAEFDRLQNLNLEGETWLQNYEERLRSESGIPSLKVRSNRVFGYYIEVTKTHLAKVPSSFERKQTTVNGERFTTQELRDREREILSASSKAEGRAQELLDRLMQKIVSLDAELRLFIDLFSWADAWAGLKRSLAQLSVKGPWIYPELLDDDKVFFEITEARHPILEAFYGDFVPNSLSLDSDKDRLLLLTGPNMAGKSTLMRQTGLCLLLAQCGVPVPASQMKFVPCSGFYSRMGASDRILAGESTFMVEMKETATLLREADHKSFVLIDEIGRGTSTTDGLAIARAVLEHLHDQVKALCIFATHYHELSEDALRLSSAFNASMGIKEWRGQLVFLRKLVREAAQSSYGLYVAKWAGLPQSLLQQAQREHSRLLAQEVGTKTALDQMSLFASGSPAEKEDNSLLYEELDSLKEENQKLRNKLDRLKDIFEE